MREEWIVPWALWVWAALFGAIIVFELITLYMNRKADDGTRRNLTAYVRAWLGVGDRRLTRKGPRWVAVVFLTWLLLHFLGYA
jgi:hypothetical protein